jgi:hypothetical protein
MKTRNETLAESIGQLIASRITPELISQIEAAAVESDDGESDKPIAAKFAAAIKWNAGADPAEVTCKITFTTRHIDESDVVVDSKQIALKFEVVGGAQ